jgi:hypothetical protein
MTYLFERPLDKPGDTYMRQGYANRILREHGGNKTPIANPFAHWDPNFDHKLKVFKDAKPLGSDQHSMNEIHDHRSVINDVNITSLATLRSIGRTARWVGRGTLYGLVGKGAEAHKYARPGLSELEKMRQDPASRALRI